MGSAGQGSVSVNGNAPWLAHYPKCVPQHLEYPREPAFWLLEQTASQAPERVACCYFEQRLTFADLLHKARQLSAALRERGLQPGERVGLLLPNIPEYVISLFGIWMAGGVAVTLNPMMVKEELVDLIVETNCRFAITLDVLLPLIHSPVSHLNGNSNGNSPLTTILVTSIKNRLPRWQRLAYSSVRLRRLGWRSLYHGEQSGIVHDFDDALESAGPAAEPYRAAPESPAYILPTGGTTGFPKAVVLTHRNVLANALQLFHWAGARFGRHEMLAVLPFFHSYGLSASLMHGVALGATLIMHHRFQPRPVLNLIQRHRPTIFLAVPAMLVALNKVLREKKFDLSSIQYCISGGAALDPHVADEFAAYSGATVVQGYGLSEASPVTHVGPLDGTAKPGSIGFPLPDTEARIVDAETGVCVLSAGEVGELTIRGPQVMAGYLNNPAATAHAIRDGWLYTGDLATYDADGFFRIVDRKKDLIITSGNNVFPTDVEQVLRGFTGLLDVAVVGVPDEERGELVKAVVSVEKGQVFDHRKFEEFAKQHLASYKRPRLVEVIEGDLPRNPLGKVLRRLLRAPHGDGNGQNAAAAAVEVTAHT